MATSKKTAKTRSSSTKPATTAAGEAGGVPSSIKPRSEATKARSEAKSPRPTTSSSAKASKKPAKKASKRVSASSGSPVAVPTAAAPSTGSATKARAAKTAPSAKSAIAKTNATGKGRATKAASPTRAAKSDAKLGSKRRTQAAPEVSEDEDEGESSTPRSKGKQLVIVESPAKAKTINKYLGPGFEVRASVGHIRDLPSKSPRGSKAPVPGVDLEADFEPTYEVLPDKAKTVAELKRAAKHASSVWFATDLDREGEAIAWHLASVLGIKPSAAKRVVFNAITKPEIERAFRAPRPIDEGKVNAQQARRILDRIVGYQASPLLWKKVARGLSAGRVQSVAVRLVVEREREIEAFVPDEHWRFGARLAAPQRAPGLSKDWSALLADKDEAGRGPSVKAQNAWMHEQGAVRAELWELGGKRFELGCPSNAPRDLSAEVLAAAKAVGFADAQVHTTVDPEGRGPARHVRTITGKLDPKARYRVRSVEQKRSSSQPSPPFITSTLQMAASSQLGFGAQRTMRLAQDLYEGVPLAGEGQVALITYMRTDSTHLSPEAVEAARSYIARAYGSAYLPAAARSYTSSNKDAQEAHEAIRPNDPSRHPDEIRAKLTGPRAEDQYKLYRLIWSRFVACQMTAAQWDQTAVVLDRVDVATGATLRATGRTLAFDGYYRAIGIPHSGDEQTLPALTEGAEVSPFAIEPEQKFTSPPPRYTEASLVKTLEAEGIGRPSTYASIIQVIQDRQYVEQRERRFHATDLGEVVTDKLIEAFPSLMDLGYTRQMESELDHIEESEGAGWRRMLRRFYDDFSAQLGSANESMTHAKAELQPAPYACPSCGSRTAYRFGRNGRFLSCSNYPECNYAAPIDRRGRPMLPERVDIVCPEDGSLMELRNGRFGAFLASVNYPVTSYVLNLDKRGNLKYPSTPALDTDVSCPKCSSPMSMRRGKRGPWLGCSAFPKCRGRVAWTSLEADTQARLERELAKHEVAHPQVVLHRQDGSVVPEGTPISQLVVPGGVVELAIHPDARAEESEAAKRARKAKQGETSTALAAG